MRFYLFRDVGAGVDEEPGGLAFAEYGEGVVAAAPVGVSACPGATGARAVPLGNSSTRCRAQREQQHGGVC